MKNAEHDRFHPLRPSCKISSVHVLMQNTCISIYSTAPVYSSRLVQGILTIVS